MKRKVITFIYSLCFIFFSFDIFCQDTSPLISQTTYGGIGLIQTPTARFSEDGELFGISKESPYNRLFAKIQFFPWFEGVVRYTEGTFWPYYGKGTSSEQTWKDKGMDFKFRLFNEGKYLPAVAIGVNDLGGTGAYGSEYIVASKKINNFDFTMGLGWGRLNGTSHISNPATWISDSRNRRGGSTKLGGTINLSRFFSGETASIFSGIEYYTPWPNLSLKLEYDTSDYSNIVGEEKVFDKTGDIFELESRINLALNYRYELSTRDKLDLSLGFLHGNTIYANLAVHSNLNFSGPPKFIAPPEVLNRPYLEPYRNLDDNWKKYLTDLIIWQMGNVGFVTHQLIFNDNELQVEISQGRFLNPAQALDLANRILANNAPKNINKFTIINIDQGIETLRATISREELEQSVRLGPLDEDLLLYSKREFLENDAIVVENKNLYPNFFWNIRPHMLGTLQHQERFYFWQLEALIHSEYSFMKGLYLTTDIGINIIDNYEDYSWHVPDGKLHHVRQDRRLYLTEGKSGLRRMAIDYLVDFHPNITAKVSAGYLEWMYAGFGGEIIYMPDHRNWAVGLDTYWLKQRDFDQGFSLADYETVTGFLSFYYDLPIYNMRVKASAGRFLGKDKGVLMDISRQFSTGARIGGRAAITDCDATCVGEGSFNKWIYFELPMDLFFVRSTTRSKAGYAWSPLTKDAGTQVESGSLYNLLVNAPDEVKSLRRTPWSFKKIFSGFSTKPQKAIK